MSSFRYLCPDHAEAEDFELACEVCNGPACYVSKREVIERPTDMEDVSEAARTLRSLGLHRAAVLLESRWAEVEAEP